MKVFYISSRINAPDGSSVHGRAFVRNVQKLGHTIETYPPVQPIRYIREKSGPDTRSRWQKFRDAGAATIIKSRVRRLGRMGSDLVNLWDGLEETVRYYLGARKIMRRFQPDVLVFRTTLFNFAPQLLRRFHGIPCVAEVNAIKYLEISVASRSGMAAKLTHRAETYAITRSDRVFAVSEPIKEFVDGFYPPEHSFVVPNGVETDDFDPARYDPAALKAELGIAGRTVLGYVGSYKEWHGLPVSLDLIELLRESHPEFLLLLIGNGEQYAHIKSEIARRGLQDFVKQIDYVAHDEVPKYLSLFDYAVMTYPDFDGFYFSPLKMYEYMSMGIPVVSTNTGQIAAMLEAGVTGELVYPPEAANFRDAILALHQDQAKYQRMAEASRAEVLAKHSWLENARQVMAISEALLASRKQ
ncbi:glycosyltransferase family 4 protein [Granulosicoccaceae sp. 1_MG-2023]|nr:glycosyltransferase family 4 protein [Granulosicoccaceae sp. 1_MG-2023]